MRENYYLIIYNNYENVCVCGFCIVEYFIIVKYLIVLCNNSFNYLIRFMCV